jgi:hypothetical protein
MMCRLKQKEEGLRDERRNLLLTKGMFPSGIRVQQPTWSQFQFYNKFFKMRIGPACTILLTFILGSFLHWLLG